MLKIGLPVLVLTVLSACGDDAAKISEKVAQIPVDLEVSRFDRAFDQMEPENLPDLKARYPYLFPPQFPDSIWLAKKADTLQVHLREEVARAFPDFAPYASGLELLFKHVKFYFPEQQVPRVVTLTTDVDYRSRVVLTDTLLLIGLDNYLGPDHPFYGNMDRYIARSLDATYLVSDVAAAFAQKVVPPPSERSLISQMVYYGKLLYLKDRLLPLAPDSVKIAYTGEELEWARANESQIWRYFIERELLYSTDRELGPRFLDPAPFSKFRLELDNETPGRIGRYMGWQVVRAYAESHPDTRLKQLLNLPGEEIFRQSNYKPPK
ncbi:gliding motility lipoprotein GldB [Robiginitalea sp. SC105]|nr:gliding motility lipoprotein GldB [Robiginitalea sp. SC105]